MRRKSGRIAISFTPILLIFWMFLFTLSFRQSAWADSGRPLARIGSRYYLNMQSAVDEVRDGETIVLLRAVTTGENVQVRNNRSFTIDFAGYLYQYAAPGIEKNAYTIRNGNVKIRRINMKQTAGAEGDLFDILGAASLTIYNGTLLGSFENSGKLIVKDGSFNCKDQFAVIANYGKLTISGGSFLDQIVSDGKMDIRGGSILTEGDTPQIFVRSGSATIRAGVFTSLGPAVNLMISDKGKVTISGGTFKAPPGVDNVLDEGVLTVTGGKFNSSIDVNSDYNPVIRGVPVRVVYG